MKRTILLLAVGFLFTTSTPAQISVGAHVGTLIDDNVTNNSLQIPDRLTEFSLQGAYDWESESGDVQMFYTGLMNYFSLLPSRSFQIHTTGLTYSHVFGDDGETLLNAGSTMALRQNRDDFTFYNHTQMSLYGNVRTYLSDRLTMKGSYSFRWVSFAELSDFNYLEHYLFAQAALSLPPKTTVIVQVDLGFKKYETGNPDTLSRISGRGNGGKQGTAPGNIQLIGTARIGQGIAEGTGLSVAGQYQVSLQKESRYLALSDGLLTDDELFDDHYGYDGPMGTLMLTQLFPWDIRSRLAGTVQRRLYSDRPAYDLSGQQIATQRIDNRSVLSLSIEKMFPAAGFNLSLTYDYIVNRSNDAYFQYRNNAFSVRVSFAY